MSGSTGLLGLGSPPSSVFRGLVGRVISLLPVLLPDFRRSCHVMLRGTTGFQAGFVGVGIGLLCLETMNRSPRGQATKDESTAWFFLVGISASYLGRVVVALAARAKAGLARSEEAGLA